MANATSSPTTSTVRTSGTVRALDSRVPADREDRVAYSPKSIVQTLILPGDVQTERAQAKVPSVVLRKVHDHRAEPVRRVSCGRQEGPPFSFASTSIGVSYHIHYHSSITTPGRLRLTHRPMASCRGPHDGMRPSLTARLGTFRRAVLCLLRRYAKSHSLAGDTITTYYLLLGCASYCAQTLIRPSINYNHEFRSLPLLTVFNVNIYIFVGDCQ